MKKVLKLYTIAFFAAIISSCGNQSNESSSAYTPTPQSANESQVVSETRGELTIGMTKDEVRKIWGEPKRMSKRIVGDLVLEHWTYPDWSSVDFENGRLTIIKER